MSGAIDSPRFSVQVVLLSKSCYLSACGTCCRCGCDNFTTEGHSIESSGLRLIAMHTSAHAVPTSNHTGPRRTVRYKLAKVFKLSATTHHSIASNALPGFVGNASPQEATRNSTIPRPLRHGTSCSPGLSTSGRWASKSQFPKRLNTSRDNVHSDPSRRISFWALNLLEALKPPPKSSGLT